LAIWRFVKENDNGVTNFHFEIAADLITEDELEVMSDMRPGLIQLEIGVQSTNSLTLEAINRRMDLDKLREVVQKIHGFMNIHQHLDLIAGLPFEDYVSFGKSFDDVYNMKPNQLQLGFWH
jgi:coproporphyrinogen III oxidase-like Fe-S oxidoreductase